MKVSVDMLTWPSLASFYGRLARYRASSSGNRMSFLVNPFSRSSQAGNAWFCAGAVTLYPNLDDSARVGEQRPCGEKKHVPGCRVFHVPRDDSSKATEVAIDDWKDPEVGGDAKDQVMVFRYKGKFCAINHVCCDIRCCTSGAHVNHNICRNAHTRHIHSLMARPSILKTLASC